VERVSPNYELLSELNETEQINRRNIMIVDITDKLIQFRLDYKLQFSPFRDDISPEEMQEYFDDCDSYNDYVM